MKKFKQRTGCLSLKTDCASIGPADIILFLVNRSYAQVLKNFGINSLKINP